MTNHQAGFTLIEMIVVTAVLGIVASVTAPNLFSSRVMANERAVVATLRNLATAQTQCMARAAVDTDGDGVGEALGLFELAGTSALRDGGAPLAPNAITASLGTAQPSGFVSTKGYLLALYLPDAAGNGVLATAANAGSIDANGAEVAFTCLAWPMSHGRSGNATFFLSLSGEVLVTRDATYSGLTSVPPPGAALVGGDPLQMLSTSLAVGQTGADGFTWQVAP